MNGFNAKSHAHRVLPISLYLLIGGALIVMTLATVIIASFDFGGWNIVIALSIASFKGSLVALYFMHLKYDNGIFTIVFISSLIFLALFITFTMFDTHHRGDINEDTIGPIRLHATIYDDNGSPLPMAERKFAVKAGTTAGTELVDEAPFELLHGYGPIKEVIEVGPLDTVIALQGKPIFESKCATCHKLDERYTGPPLRNVSAYRSPTFIMNQILDPKQNIANHPDMQAMLKTYYTYMTNQNVSVEEARILVEYLRWEFIRGQTQQ